MFEFEDRKKITKEIRQLVEKMKTVIKKLIITKDERNDYPKDY